MSEENEKSEFEKLSHRMNNSEAVQEKRRMSRSERVSYVKDQLTKNLTEYNNATNGKMTSEDIRQKVQGICERGSRVKGE